MKITKIGVDIDGVIADFTYGFSKLCNKKFGTHIMNTKDVTDWNWENFYPITKEQVKELFEQDIGQCDKFWTELPLLENCGFDYFTEHFSNDPNYEVYFITHRENGKHLKAQTINWLENMGWKNPQVLVVRDKAKLIDLLGIEWFVDDKPETIVDIYNHYGIDDYDGKFFIYDQPYNQHLHLISYPRIKSLIQYTDTIKKIGKKYQIRCIKLGAPYELIEESDDVFFLKDLRKEIIRGATQTNLAGTYVITDSTGGIILI